MTARYYEAGEGIIITSDTFHEFENNPQSLNQYVYCKNNPVMHVDPSGHWLESIKIEVPDRCQAHQISMVIHDIKSSMQGGAMMISNFMDYLVENEEVIFSSWAISDNGSMIGNIIYGCFFIFTIFLFIYSIIKKDIRKFGLFLPINIGIWILIFFFYILKWYIALPLVCMVELLCALSYKKAKKTIY